MRNTRERIQSITQDRKKCIGNIVENNGVKTIPKIEWISCGKTVQTDETTLLLDKYKPEKYVRFVLTGANGKLFSQPFLFIEKF